MTGVCAMCKKKTNKLVAFSEFRGNCRRDTLVCEDCRKLRASNGGTCLTCKYYDPSRCETSDVRGGCEKYYRYVEFADRCGQYEVKE